MWALCSRQKDAISKGIGTVTPRLAPGTIRHDALLGAVVNMGCDPHVGIIGAHCTPPAGTSGHAQLCRSAGQAVTIAPSVEMSATFLTVGFVGFVFRLSGLTGLGSHA